MILVEGPEQYEVGISVINNGIVETNVGNIGFKDLFDTNLLQKMNKTFINIIMSNN